MLALVSRTRILASMALVGVVVFSAVYAKQASAPTTFDLNPSKKQNVAARTIIEYLDQLHYEQRTLNPDLANIAFDRYIKELDSQRVFFSSKDIADFEVYRPKFEQTLKTGDLKPAFIMYNRYQQRATERFNFILNTLNNGIERLDFNQNDTVELDREKSAWATSATELDELWIKRIKSAVLNLRLAGKADADIQKTLTKRYKSQLNNMKRTKSDDAFQVYMNAFTESFDPHTEYFSPRSEENFNINMSLSLEGIGAVLQSDDEYTKVLRLVPGGPADKAQQLKSGDRIVAVAQGDQEYADVVGWRIDEVVELIRGPKGSTVRLQVIPAGSVTESQTREIKIVRNKVKLEDQAAQKKVITVKRGAELVKIGVIKLPEFYADFQAQQAGDPNYRSTTRDVKRLINELKAENISGLILDLRNNGGGSLSEANTLVGLFIGTGPTVQVKNSNGNISALGDPDPSVEYAGPLAVMVNRLSASAAEIFAGAIQDYGRGLVIGNNTFGKGTVQSLRGLEYGELKLTEAKFYRISGESTQHNGVKPDITFPNIYDIKEIGESALPNALAWDKIPAAHYAVYQSYQKVLPTLQQASDLRQEKDPDFQFIKSNIHLAKELKAQKIVSLNFAKRKQEKTEINEKRLTMENKRRLAKGQLPVKNWQEIEDEEEKLAEEADPKREKPEDNAFISEAAQILLDSVTNSTASIKIGKK
jgi:carboxyl-terminal processing protease